MATMTRKPTSVKSADVCRLTLSIRGVDYNVRPTHNEDGRAWRLRKADGTTYWVAETPYGPTCDCPDQVWRREGRDPAGCKHLRSLRAAGLVEGGVR
jgi:hypothetical protein